MCKLVIELFKKKCIRFPVQNKEVSKYQIVKIVVLITVMLKLLWI